MKKELMKLVTKLKQEMSSKYSLNLLMLVEREGYSKFRLLVSSDTLKSNLATVSFLSKELAKILTKEEFKILSGVEVVEPKCDFFLETQNYLDKNGNPEELYHQEFGGIKIKRALVIISPVNNSRKYVRQAELIDLKKQLQQNNVQQQLQQVLMQLKQFLARKYLTKDEFKLVLNLVLNGKYNFSKFSSEKQNHLQFSIIVNKDSINE